MKYHHLTAREFGRSLLIAAGIFVVFGTITALWENSFFTRMVPVSGYEYALLLAESLLLGIYFGVRVSKSAGTCSTTGGILGFLGIACPVCNKILLLLFGSTLLLTYFEPVRLYVGIAGILLLGLALHYKLSLQEQHTSLHHQST